jgi:hypothetical protein
VSDWSLKADEENHTEEADYDPSDGHDARSACIKTIKKETCSPSAGD